MTDLELENMELEYTLKQLKRVKAICKAQSRLLNDKCDVMVAIIDKIVENVIRQNRDTELYGKNSYEATYSRGIVNAWCSALEIIGYVTYFSYDEENHDLIAEISIKLDNHVIKIKVSR